MTFLYFLEGIRNPVLTAIMSAITYLGHEIIPIAIICILYWCINKRLAYQIGFSYFASGLTLQALKITFRVDRPWVIDPDFKPVESAKGHATGYSFPSGHTQSATSLYGSFALFFKKPLVKILFVLIFLTVGFSRMYLGVHTPRDVLVSMGMTIVLTLIAYYFIQRIYDTNKYDLLISVIMTVISIGVIVYAIILNRMDIVPYKYVSDCCKAGGAGLGFALGWYIERRYINFNVKASGIMQVFKAALGIITALILKSGIKAFFGENVPVDIIRYFILVLWIIALFPAIIKKYRLGRS